MAELEKERAERVGDPQVSAAYRELGAAEPPRALDEAILAAARKQARPWTQRFAAPLGLAAVLVLSVTVTLRMQHEQPGIEAPAVTQKEAAAPEAPLSLKPEVQIKSAAEPARQRQAPRKEQAEPKPFADQAPAAAAAPASPDMLASRADAGRLAESNIGGSAARQAEERTARDAEAAARAHQAGALLAKRPLDQQPAPPAAPAAAAALQQPVKAEQAARVSADTPEREFERIAQLRAEGRHDEADKAFLEFRRRYPGFRITEEMLRRVERR